MALLPCGTHRVDDRRAIGEVLHMLRSGAPRTTVPLEMGHRLGLQWNGIRVRTQLDSPFEIELSVLALRKKRASSFQRVTRY